MNTVSILNTNKDSLFQKILKTFGSLFFSIYVEISQELMAPALVPNAPIGLIYALDSRDFNTPACQPPFAPPPCIQKRTSEPVAQIPLTEANGCDKIADNKNH